MHVFNQHATRLLSRLTNPACLPSSHNMCFSRPRALTVQDRTLAELSGHVILSGSQDSFVDFARTLHSMWGQWRPTDPQARLPRLTGIATKRSMLHLFHALMQHTSK